MIRHSKPVILGIVALILLPSSFAQKNKKNEPEKLTELGRQTILRTFQAETPFARTYFPMGKVGLKIDPQGNVTPGRAEVGQMVAQFGPAAKPGDRVKITNVYFKGSNIIFEINGGPVKRKKWYERIQMGAGGAMATPGGGDPDVVETNARGSYIALTFKDYIPELSMDQIRAMLKPALDFNSLSAAEAYAKAMPPIVQKAIKEHRALVGMDRDMVTAAMGRPPKKYRDRDGDTDYEEWIYGQPPQEVSFVRFVGDRVVRIETMKVDGQKEIRTAKEVDLDQDNPTLAKKEDDEPTSSQKGPSLLRPGEKPVTATPSAPMDPSQTPPPPTSTSPTGPSGMPDPSQTGPGQAPGVPPMGGPPTIPPN